MKLFTALAATVLGLWSFTTSTSVECRAESPSNDVAKLVGNYRIVAGERNGEKIEADRLQGISVRIAKNAITTLDRQEKEIYVATYEIDANKRPYRLLMTAQVTPMEGNGGKGTKAAGLIDFDGETIKLIYALPGGESPTEFRAGEKQQMFVLQPAERLATKPTNK